MASELVQRKVTVIVAFFDTCSACGKGGDSNNPYCLHNDQRSSSGIGFVASLNRPGGNITGVTIRSVEVGPKLLELLHEAVPTAKVMALLVNPTNPQTEPLSETCKQPPARPACNFMS